MFDSIQKPSDLSLSQTSNINRKKENANEFFNQIPPSSVMKK